MNESSISQLLTDCLRDQLIEGYTQLPEGVALWRAGKRKKMTREQAHQFLMSLTAGEAASHQTGNVEFAAQRKG